MRPRVGGALFDQPDEPAVRTPASADPVYPVSVERTTAWAGTIGPARQSSSHRHKAGGEGRWNLLQ